MELPILKAKFRYAGFARYVENVTVEWGPETFIGMEVRKGGKFSNKIKRYSMSRVEGEIEWLAGKKQLPVVFVSRTKISRKFSPEKELISTP